MEMNTRLQVEHPVTEEITGVDLVEWQLRVASGEAIPLKQEELSINGHAIEARLYAEDPANGFLPSVGRLANFHIPDDGRIETGVEKGDEISVYYDPMIAKLICNGEKREMAIRQLFNVLGNTKIEPIKTNAVFLKRALKQKNFCDGDLDTGFIERYFDKLIPSNIPSNDVLRSAALQQLHSEVTGYPEYLCSIHSGRSPLPRLQGNIWREAIAFRLNAPKHPVEIKLDDGLKHYTVNLGNDFEKHEYTVDEKDGIITVEEIDDHNFRFKAVRYQTNAAGTASDGAILSPMPGKIIALDISEGDSVTKGQKLLTLEAMKMEHSLTAPFDGIITKLNAGLDAQVQVDALLVQIETEA